MGIVNSTYTCTRMKIGISQGIGIEIFDLEFSTVSVNWVGIMTFGN